MKKKTKTKYTGPRTAKQMLKQIDAFLSRKGEQGERLWDVLSALRGPDFYAFNEKAQSTVPIRNAAFPKTAAAINAGTNLSVNNIATLGGSEKFITPTTKSRHFNEHAEKAANVLGLIK